MKFDQTFKFSGGWFNSYLVVKRVQADIYVTACKIQNNIDVVVSGEL